jgi:TonB-linked SusC/RagA family outer membrane protein
MFYKILINLLPNGYKFINNFLTISSTNMERLSTRMLRFLGMLTIVFISLSAYSQRTITGTITDASTGEALISANVTVKGTTTGTVTDLDGKYSLRVPDGATTLVFSYIGYADQEIEIGASNVIDVQMSSGQVLEELVVVGYGTVAKKDLTGAVTKLEADDFNAGVITSPEQLIQGKVPGVQILANSGAPGAGATIRIRGVASPRADNRPLIVIDGVPLDSRSPSSQVTGLASLGNTPGSNPLNFINPNDIASMEILKDASATAIYGSRAANGVIMITTKKSDTGENRLSFNASVGFSNLLKKLEVLDAGQYRTALADEVGSTDNDFGGNVDAFDEITRTGITQDFNLSMSGGNDKGGYRVSLGLIDQEGIIQNTDLKRYSANLSGNYKFFKDDRLTVNINLITALTDLQSAPITNNAGFEGSMIGQALQWNPTLPLTLEDGSFNQPGNDVRNPVAFYNLYDDNQDGNTVLGNIQTSFRIIEGLDYNFLYGAYRNAATRRINVSQQLVVNDILDRGQAVIANNVLGNELFTHTLNYRKDLSSSVSLNALVGYEYQRYTNKGYTIEAQDFVTDVIPYTSNLQSSLPASRKMNSFEDPTDELQSYFGRVNLNFSEKYLFTATVRADGSTKFGADNRYGVFPSFAFAWRLSEEDFIPSAFDNLKLRLGYGLTGNREFPSGASQTRFGFDPNEEGGFRQESVANPNLKWEASEQLNAGIDFAFLNYRLTGSIDVFQRTTQDLIFQLQAIAPAPDVRFWTNLDAEVLNQGVELALNGRIISTPDIVWELGGNVSFLTNELQNYSGAPIITGEINGQGLTEVRAQRIEEGFPLYSFYLREFQGFDDNGLSIFTNDGELDHRGDPNPNVLLGINTAFSYKSFDFTMNWFGAFGHQIYNNTANALFNKGNLTNGRNTTTELLGNGESPSNPNAASTRYLEDGDYLRLANVSLAYNFDIDSEWLKGLRFFVTGQNLLLITDYSGFDPDVNTNKEVNDVASFGIEYTPYPTARTVILGVNASF